MFFKYSYKERFNTKMRLRKKEVNSGGSRKSFLFSRFIPLNLKINKLYTRVRNNAGRGGVKNRVLVRKGRRGTKLFLSVNYSFRLNLILFIGSIIILPKSHKIMSLLFLSSGAITYVPTTNQHSIFTLSRMYSLFQNTYLSHKRLNNLHKHLFIAQGFFFIKQLPRNRKISLIESFPGGTIKYVRSPSTSARPTKLDYKTNTCLLRMPSGVRKVFSLYSLGSLGPTPLVDNKY